jgi:hypothetical protein
MAKIERLAWRGAKQDPPNPLPKQENIVTVRVLLPAERESVETNIFLKVSVAYHGVVSANIFANAHPTASVVGCYCACVCAGTMRKIGANNDTVDQTRSFRVWIIF